MEAANLEGALEVDKGEWRSHPHPFVCNGHAEAWCIGQRMYAIIAQIPACGYYFVRVGDEQDTLRAGERESVCQFLARLRTWCETRIELGHAKLFSLPVARSPSFEEGEEFSEDRKGKRRHRTVASPRKELFGVSGAGVRGRKVRVKDLESS